MASSRNRHDSPESDFAHNRIIGGTASTPSTTAGFLLSLLLCQCLMLLAAGLFSRIDPDRNNHISDAAVAMDSVCRELLANTTAGRQALVSSAWWPPLPILLRLPLVAALPADTSHLPSLLISALFGACSLFLMERVFSLWKLGWQRFLMIAAVCFTPSFVRESLNGSNTTTILFLTLLTTYSMIQWVLQHRLRNLIYLSVGSAMITISSFEMWPWLAMLFLLLAMDQTARRATPQKKQAVLILGAITPLYTIGVWCLVNWLVMGDALYFLRSLLAPASAHAQTELQHITALHVGSTAVLMAFMTVSIVTRDRAGFFLTSLGTGLTTLALLLAAFGALWNSTPFTIAIFPLTITAAAYLAARSLRTPFARSAILLIPIILLIITHQPIFMARLNGQRTAANTDPLSVSSAFRVPTSEIPPLITHRILTESAHPRIFVCGYDGFLLDCSTVSEKAGTEPLFVHSLDFNFNEIKTSYAGNDLYILVHRPSGRSRMDSIHRKYPDLFEFGSNSTLHHSDWDNWRLFEIIQAPRHNPENVSE